MDAIARPTQTSLYGRPCLTRLHDPPERVYMGAHTTETKAQGRAKKTNCTNVLKAHHESQLSIFDAGSCAWACPHTEGVCVNSFEWVV